jgi:hypothetical protein
MSINRGPSDPLPTDGSQDKRPYIRCSSCLHLDRCYRGPELTATTDDVGNTWQHWMWLCGTCMSVIVDHALRQAE